MSYWIPPRMWPDSTVFIIGGGPSLLKEDLEPLRGNGNSIRAQHVIGVNDSFKKWPWIPVTYFGDARWHDWNRKYLKKYSGLVVSSSKRTEPFPDVLHVQRVNRDGVFRKPGFVSWNRNSGTSAINLAYHFGAKRIVLLGFDMKMKDDNHNWHTNHRHIPDSNIYETRFLPSFQIVARDAKILGLEIVNANPDSALTLFPFVDWKEELT